MYSGTLDFIVAQSVVKSLQQMYTDLGATNITTEYSIGMAISNFHWHFFFFFGCSFSVIFIN